MQLHDLAVPFLIAAASLSLLRGPAECTPAELQQLCGGDLPVKAWEFWSTCDELEDYCDSRARHVMGQNTCWYCPQQSIKVRWCQDNDVTDCGHDAVSSCGGKVECRLIVVDGAPKCVWDDCDFALGACPKPDCSTSRPHQIP